jgi:hypothetical protein
MDEAANAAQQAAIAIAKKKKKGMKEDWNKVNHHDHTNGLSQKAVNAYRHEHPGSKLKTAVTTKPSKLKTGSKAAKRRKSFCARMSGNKGPMRKPNGKPTPKALALRRWHCESLFELFVTAKKGIYEAEGEPSGLKHLTPHLAQDILDQMKKEGVHAIVKSIEWGDGGAKELIAMIKRDLEQIANNVTENFADGRHPEDKGDSKRLGVPTKASVSTLRKVAHQGERKGQLAHWMANMKAGREKAKHDESTDYPFAGKEVGQKAGPEGQLKGNARPRKDGKQPAFNKLVGGN